MTIIILYNTAVTRRDNLPINDIITDTNLVNLAVSLTTRSVTGGFFDNIIVLLSGPFSVNS